MGRYGFCEKENNNTTTTTLRHLSCSLVSSPATGPVAILAQAIATGSPGGAAFPRAAFAMASLASEETVATWTLDREALEAVGQLSQAAYDAISVQLGNLSTWRQLGLFSNELLREAVGRAKFESMENRSLSPLEAAQVGLIWRMARRTAGLAHGDPFEPQQPSAPGGGGEPMAASPAAGGRKVKLAHLIEQGDDTETAIVKSVDIAEWHRKYKLLTDGPVPEDLEPTNEQLSALFAKMTAGAIPYADFALWTPGNAKVPKAVRFEHSRAGGRQLLPEGTGGTP